MSEETVQDTVKPVKSEAIEDKIQSFEEDLVRRLKAVVTEARKTIRDERKRAERVRRKEESSLSSVDNLKIEVTRLEQEVKDREQQISCLVTVLEQVTGALKGMDELLCDMRNVLYWSANKAYPRVQLVRDKLAQLNRTIVSSYDGLMGVVVPEHVPTNPDETKPFEFKSFDDENR